jgi:predicted flap endonuclease-1-like 5' DNA nuclease
MVIFLVQSLLLIAAAFVIGAILGRVFKSLSPKTDSASQESTRAADARLAAAVQPANDDVSKPSPGAVAMVPPAEPVPAMAASTETTVSSPAKAKTRAPSRKTAAKSLSTRPVRTTEDDRHRPSILKNARRGKPDQLLDIDGIGNVIQSELYGLGVYHFDQIAGWNDDQAAWVSRAIGFPGRAHRENWVKQAADLVKQVAQALDKPKVAAKAKPKAPAKKPAKS